MDALVDIVQAANLAVQGDPNLLRSAIENVLRNAVRFTRPGTTVEVALRTNRVTRADEAIISIRDCGSGVPEQELTNIFRPFYRMNDARSRGSGGVGLGLAITERVARLHGGRIQAMNDPQWRLASGDDLPKSVPDCRVKNLLNWSSIGMRPNPLLIHREEERVLCSSAEFDRC
jgi:signal transduction histidine kinase